MSEDAPQNDQPTEAATPEPVAETPPPEAPAPAPEPAATAAAAPAAPAASEAETVATPVVEPVAPAAPVDPTVAAPVAAAPVAAAPAQHNGFFIPRWVGYVAIAIVGMLIVGGIGYAIGHESSSSNSNNAGANFPGGMQNGNGFPGGMQNGNGNTNGNSNGNSNLPQFPGQNGNQNGNSNGNQNGNSNGGSRTSGGFLGVAIQDPTSGSGAEVTSVQSGSPADDAGLQAGDVITKVDGTDIAGAAALSQAIRSHAAGDSVTITYTRDGNTSTAKVTLGSVSTSQTN